MNPETQLHQIEISLEKAKEAIELASALQRLHENQDFKKVILSDYFVEEASRSVKLKSDPNMQKDDQQKTIENIIVGIGSLYQYFGKVYRVGEMSVSALKADQTTREEILEEELGQGELVQ